MSHARLIRSALGLLLMAAALVFVGLNVAAHVDDLGRAIASPATWITIVVAALLYGLLSVLLVLSWAFILSRAGAGVPVTFGDSFEVYGRSQIAKYVPGNIFHFFGRQLLGKAKGWTQASIAVTSIVETLVLGSSAAAIVLLLGFVSPSLRLFDLVPPGVLAVGAVLAIAAPWILLRLLPRIVRRRAIGFLEEADALGRGPYLVVPFAIYGAFFFCTALVFWFLVSDLYGFDDADLVPGIAAAFVSGWLIGNMTPSAPGGIGIREAVMLPQLEALIGAPAAVIVVVMFRLVTIGGDVLFFLVSSLLSYRRRRLALGA